MVTFILAGLWHGAGWTFVFWGFLHGVALVIHRAWRKLDFKLWTWLAWLITFNFVNIAWIFFRADEWSVIVKVLGSMFSLDNVVLPNSLKSRLTYLADLDIHYGSFVANIQGNYYTPIWLISALFCVTLLKNSTELTKTFKTNIAYLIILLSIFLSSVGALNEFSEFLYFNF